MDTTYIDAADCAKLVRKALARAFPGVKFSVKTDRYSMGASVDVRWTDGPVTDAVEAIAHQYRGRGSMDCTDYSGDNYHYLMDDGTSILHRGNVGNYEGEVEGVSQAIGGRLVHYGAHYVSCTREMSDASRARIHAFIETYNGRPFNGNDTMTVWHDGHAFEGWGDNVAFRLFLAGA